MLFSIILTFFIFVVSLTCDSFFVLETQTWINIWLVIMAISAYEQG